MYVRTSNCVRATSEPVACRLPLTTSPHLRSSAAVPSDDDDLVAVVVARVGAVERGPHSTGRRLPLATLPRRQGQRDRRLYHLRVNTGLSDILYTTITVTTTVYDQCECPQLLLLS